MKNDRHDQEPEEGFKGMKSIFDGMQGSLFGLQIVPDEAEAEPESRRREAAKKDSQPRRGISESGRQTLPHDRTTWKGRFYRRHWCNAHFHTVTPATCQFGQDRTEILRSFCSQVTDRLTKQSHGLPFGEMPRLLLLWVVTEAVRTKNPRIKLGKSLNEFLRQIGANPETGGGKRGDAKRIKDQAQKLFKCRISFEYSKATKIKALKRF